MKHSDLSHVVVSERGTDWTLHLELGASRATDTVTLIQRQDEPPEDFALRVLGRLSELGTVSGVTVLCSAEADLHAIASRRVALDGCLAAMRGKCKPLTLICEPTLVEEAMDLEH